MATHLGNFLKQINDTGIAYPSHAHGTSLSNRQFTPEELSKQGVIINYIKNATDDVVCFDAGEYADIPDFNEDHSLTPDNAQDKFLLPFEKNWIELNVGPDRTALLVENITTAGTFGDIEDGDELIAIHMFNHGRHGLNTYSAFFYFVGCFYLKLNPSQPGLIIDSASFADIVDINILPLDLEVCKSAIGILGAFLQRLNAKTIKPVPHKASRSMNARRERKGKAVIDSFWTLEIDNTVHQKGESKGGTHASPRRHTRRGHFRRLPNGNRTYIRSCKVGDSSHGLIDKDYKLKTA